MRFDMWNVTSLYRSGSLITVARELARYKLDLVGVQEVYVGKNGARTKQGIIFSISKREQKLSIGNIIFGTS